MASGCCAGEATGTASEAYLAGDAVREARELVAELCRHFYGMGWVTGTGGSITVKVNDPAMPLADRLIVMSPSGVQKERMVAEDMHVMSADGKVLSAPVSKPWPNKPPKCSDCAPLFMKAYLMRGAGAVIHSHGIETCIATMLNPGAKEFRITHMEMIKGIKGHGFRDELVIPIIENTPYEYELTDSLSEAIAAYPKATAVLVWNHGIYVWGDSWINAKTQAECYHYLLDAAIKLYQSGIDWTTPEHGPVNSAKRLCSIMSPGIANGYHAAESLKCVVLDIEGTTTPISFVTDVMFPYARDNVRKHLTSTFDSEETKEDINLLRTQIQDGLRNGISRAVPVPPNEASKEEIINALVANVESMIKADRKITSLKKLQGHIWRTGFEKKELQGTVFEDVPEVLKNWNDSGIKVYIYSSGSREAQRLLFGNTTYGDLRKFLCGYFDTTTGNKRETRSYSEIFQSLGMDSPSQILFITDVFQEAVAAKNADDLRNGISRAVPVPPNEASKEEIINALVANVESMIKADRKITSLKKLQGHIWRTGFEKKELQGTVFEDVPEVLKKKGFEVIISIRPGNAPLPENHGFRTIKSFSKI